MLHIRKYPKKLSSNLNKKLSNRQFVRFRIHRYIIARWETFGSRDIIIFVNSFMERRRFLSPGGQKFQPPKTPGSINSMVSYVIFGAESEFDHFIKKLSPRCCQIWQKLLKIGLFGGLQPVTCQELIRRQNWLFPQLKLVKLSTS